jgi:amidase
MGGSIRIPASECGLVGLKPTRARGTLAPDFGEYWGPLTHEHVVTRSVRDCAAVLDAIAGPAPGDPYTAPPPSRPFAREIGASPGSLRIGFTLESGLAEIHPECARAVDLTAKLLAELGHRVKPARVAALDEQLEATAWISASVAHDLDRIGRELGAKIGPDDLEPMNWMLAENGRRMSAVEYVASAEAAQAWARRIQKWWADGHDVLVTPTLTTPPPRLGRFAPDVPIPQLMAGMGALGVFTWPFNVTGQPAISLPLHWTPDGLPIGVQLIAAYGREDVLLRLAAQLEAARPWAGRLPRIHA